MYEAYTLSDQVWTPQLPAHWEFQRAKCIFDSPKEKNEGNKESNVLSLTLKGVIHNSKENPIGLSPADYATYQIFEANDLVFKLIDLENVSTSRVGIVPERGIMSSAYIRFSARKEINVRYFYYQYHDWWLRQIFNGLGAGVRQTLSAQDLLNLKLAVPPRKEQDQIVRYLDWQVSKINHLIHGYQKQIKLLDERKCTQINQVLVSGLNSNVNTTQSKALWMEETPCHWTQYRVKDIMYEVNERSKEGKEPHLSMSQKYGLVTDDVDIERRLLSESYVGAKVCNKDDLVLNRLKAHLGVFALAPHLGVVSPDYTVLRLRQDRVIPKYAEYLLKCNDCRKELVIRVRGIVEGFWRLYTQDLYSIYICIPGIKEQEEILEYISQLEENYQVVKDKLQKEVLLLKEYRTRLISDVVTGQIDVRDVVIPEYTPEEDTEIDIDDTGEDMEEVAEDAE